MFDAIKKKKKKHEGNIQEGLTRKKSTHHVIVNSLFNFGEIS